MHNFTFKLHKSNSWKCFYSLDKFWAKSFVNKSKASLETAYAKKWLRSFFWYFVKVFKSSGEAKRWAFEVTFMMRACSDLLSTLSMW